jgi:hypothetical protein
VSYAIVDGRLDRSGVPYVRPADFSVAVFPLSARPLIVAGIGARINIRLKAVALIQVE